MQRGIQTRNRYLPSNSPRASNSKVPPLVLDSPSDRYLSIFLADQTNMASFSTSCSITVATFALLLVIVASDQTSTSIDDILSPLLSPIFGNVCKEVGCGKGKCKSSDNGTFPPFECVCDEGWKQPLGDREGFKFLPCVIPNCSIDYSCSAASPSPALSPQNITKGSSSDPCRSNFCGGGTCQKSTSSSSSSSTSSSFSSSFSSSYSCSCSEGYNNLFNSTSFPCLQECSLGSDCQKLGISLFNHSNNASSPSAANVTNEARSLQGKLSCIIVLIGLVSVVFSI